MHCKQATRHAEFEAMDEVLGRLGREEGERVLAASDLYVTCEPCIMCAGALSVMRIRSGAAVAFAARALASRRPAQGMGWIGRLPSPNAQTCLLWLPERQIWRLRLHPPCQRLGQPRLRQASLLLQRACDPHMA